MRKLIAACLLGVTLYVQGCGLMQVQPQTPRQQVVVVYGMIEAAYNTIVARYDAGLLPEEKGRKLIATLNRAEAYVDMSKDAIKAGDMGAGEDYLKLAEQLLLEIEKELANG